MKSLDIQSLLVIEYRWSRQHNGNRGKVGNSMIIKGKLIKCNRQVKTFKGREQAEKLYITLAEVEALPDDIKDAFSESGKTFTPDWVKDFEGFANFATQYELPCRDLRGAEHESVEEFIKDFDWKGADVALSYKAKKGAVYPVSIVFESEGEPFDAFADFDKKSK